MGTLNAGYCNSVAMQVCCALESMFDVPGRADVPILRVRTQLKKLVTYVLSSVFVLTAAGCDGSADSQTMAISIYNYTSSSLYDIHIQAASSKFNVDSSARGGSVFQDLADAGTLTDGRRYTSESDVCCFLMSKASLKSGLRIVWSEVYDLDAFRQPGSGYDERRDRGSHPGAIWCTTIVRVEGEVTQQTNKLVLHFLPDGAVIAVLGSYLADRPLDGTEVARHESDHVERKTCRTETENPWYGAPAKRHME